MYVARFAHREWLPVIMLGWYGGDLYWKYLWGVDGPPVDGVTGERSDVFDGVPIAIRGVRL